MDGILEVIVLVCAAAISDCTIVEEQPDVFYTYSSDPEVVEPISGRRDEYTFVLAPKRGV